MIKTAPLVCRVHEGTGSLSKSLLLVCPNYEEKGLGQGRYRELLTASLGITIGPGPYREELRFVVGDGRRRLRQDPDLSGLPNAGQRDLGVSAAVELGRRWSGGEGGEGPSLRGSSHAAPVSTRVVVLRWLLLH